MYNLTPSITAGVDISVIWLSQGRIVTLERIGGAEKRRVQRLSRSTTRVKWWSVPIFAWEPGGVLSTCRGHHKRWKRPALADLCHCQCMVDRSVEILIVRKASDG